LDIGLRFIERGRVDRGYGTRATLPYNAMGRAGNPKLKTRDPRLIQWQCVLEALPRTDSPSREQSSSRVMR